MRVRKQTTRFAPCILFFTFYILHFTLFSAPLVSETLNLTNGWNAVYIETTPTNSPCDEFFADLPVISAAAYRSDADASTAQYDTSGNEIVQVPVVYLQWVRGKTGSTLQSIVGGGTYLLFATNSATKVIYGVPAAPKMTWRKVASNETNEFFNIVGVSSAEKTVSIEAYFNEGPFGLTKSGRSICAIGGEDPNGPVLKNAEGAFGRQTPLESGKAYALTSTCAGEWPGVIGVQGSGVYFGSDANYASIKIQNCGTTNHTFTIKMVAADSGDEPPPISRQLPRIDALSELGYTNVEENVAWTVSLAPDALSEQVFRIDRSKLDNGITYSAILVIEDLGASKMRVRLPIIVRHAATGAVAYPTGLWVGEIALNAVSEMGDTNFVPVKAGGTLRMSVMMHIDADRKCKLLQRVVAGVDTNGTARLFKDFANIPPEVEESKRFSTVMMSVDAPIVAAVDGSVFGDDTAFTWTVAPDARDNPFRHAWHPDHDGKKADYSGPAPSGDNFENYRDPIKPELWSISNRLDFSWHELGNRALPVNFPYNADETTSGVVTWEVWGLVANGPIKSVGTFTLRRVFKAAELEE